MSYLESLLAETRKLEPHEISDLGNWLKTLQGDCEMFGETPEDAHRMARIVAAIKRNMSVEEMDRSTLM